MESSNSNEDLSVASTSASSTSSLSPSKATNTTNNADFFPYSQVPGNPTFRDASVNAVAVVPLLSTTKDGELTSTHSYKSFQNLMNAIRRQRLKLQNSELAASTSHPTTAAAPGPESPASADATKDGIATTSCDENEILLVVPNSSLTRPGDWRYNDTPLKGFHWQHGCQRLRVFDGRPQCTRLAHDRLINQYVTRDYIDLYPCRRTAAVIGVLNLRDCVGTSAGATGLARAEEELRQWTNRYATPPYEVTAHGRNFERDRPVERLFVFDSFHEDCQHIDLTASKMQNNDILAFPPVEEEHIEMMDLHLKIVINDLAVTIFRSLEKKIKNSDAITANMVVTNTQEGESLASRARGSLSRYITGSTTPDSAIASSGHSVSGAGVGVGSGTLGGSGEEPVANRLLSLKDMASFVNPESKLGQESPRRGGLSPKASFSSEFRSTSIGSTTSVGSAGSSGAAGSAGERSGSFKFASTFPKLITPIDHSWEQTSLSSRDLDAIRKRDAARREKWAADLTLLAGSPLDAYERYLKAAELCKTGTPDPLWYASALEGCAAAHIAMAEGGGYGVDEYLENNFQMPEDIMVLAKDDNKRQTSASSNKQTLPEVVFALCDEALNITNRHEDLGPLHVELILKLAWYVAESSEAHLRCRWGEGDGCYAGEVDDIPRWQKPSVYKLRFSEPRTREILSEMVTLNTFYRTKQVSELLHEAASVANIQPCTRVDVAARCARICLDPGIKATQWKETKAVGRIKLPRKAAYFSVIAAEALSTVRRGGAEARDLWLLASQLYTKNPNLPDRGGDYGWAALRAITLNALSTSGNSVVSLHAAEELLSLLSEITPKLPEDAAGPKSPHKKAAKRASSRAVSVPSEQSRPMKSSSGHGGDRQPSAPERGYRDSSSDDNEVAPKASAFAKTLRNSLTSLTASTVLAHESRWAEGDPIKHVDVPLATPSEAFDLVPSAGCVWRSISFDDCANSQLNCIDRITKLRRALPTISTIHAEASSSDTSSLPLYVTSALAIEPEPALEFERVKKTAKDASQGAMATFYNPFERKRSKKDSITIVAEGEERAMSLEFTNRLAVPLVIQRCQLEFENEGNGRIKATPIAFTLSPKASGFAVRFPFSVLSSSEAGDGTIFEVKGISLTLLSRVVFLPFNSTRQDSGVLPKTGSLYLDRTMKKRTDQDVVEKPRFETCPSQPRLLIHFADSDAPVAPEKPLQAGVAEGELYTLPSLKLNNYSGPSGHGNVEQLQVYAVDLPGMQDQKIYDSEEDKPTMSEDDFVKQLLLDDASPPIRLRLLASSFSLEKVNSKDGAGSVITFQVGASQSIKKRLKDNKAEIKIRFRYRGPATSTATFWRKKEVLVKVSCVTGPRISSMEFRPDLAFDSAFSDMCRSFKLRESLAVGQQGEKDSAITSLAEENYGHNLYRVGLDNGMHVASDKVVFVLTVANETDSEVLLNREGGQIGFDNCPLPSIQVHTGVSAKFPVVISRIPRVKEDGSTVDLAEEIVSLTKLRWETKREDGEIAKGYIRIPSGPLLEITNEYPSFATRACEPPCTINIFVEGSKTSGGKASTIQIGRPVQVIAKVSIARWVPPHVAEKCAVTLEFFSALEIAATNVHTTGQTTSRDYVWSGKIKEQFRMADGDDKMKHQIKIVFVKPGVHSVSACARIRRDGMAEDIEEVWWAPIAAKFVVESFSNAAQ